MGITLQFSGVNCDKMTGISFLLEAGEIKVLHAAGKEEKIAVIDVAIGERRPDAGTVTLGGAALDTVPLGSIGWVPENGGLISNLKAWENVTLPLWYHGKRRVAETEDRVARLLPMLGVEGGAMERFMASPAGYLVPTDRKRAGLLRGLLLAPKVLVVDAALFNGVPHGVRAAWAAALDVYVREAEDRSVLVAATDGDAALPWTTIE